MSRLVWLDTETTGVDPWKARIIEAAFAPSDGPALVFRCNPGDVEWEPGAIEAHGIRPEDVADLPPFAAHAEQVQRMLDGAVIGGYNIRTFDTILIDRELRMAGQPGLLRDPERAGRIIHPEIDLLRLWHHFEPRTLEGALKRFMGLVPEGFKAHSADNDVVALPFIFNGMALAFESSDWPLVPAASFETAHDVEKLCALSVPEGEVDRSGRFKRDAGGVVRIGFGKHGPGGSDSGHPEGTAAARVPTSYLEWMIEKAADMPEDSREVARWYLSRRPGQGSFL